MIVASGESIPARTGRPALAFVLLTIYFLAENRPWRSGFVRRPGMGLVPRRRLLRGEGGVLLVRRVVARQVAEQDVLPGV
jgi:hypothetical protein